MKTLLLLSILIAMIAIPLRAVGVRSPKAAAQRIVFRLAIFSVFYVFALRFIYPRLL